MRRQAEIEFGPSVMALQLLCIINDAIPKEKNTMNKDRTVTKEERGCISNRTLPHWGDSQKSGDRDNREKGDQNCLNDCRICGTL